MTTLLQTVKLAMAITSTAFDAELSGLITAAISDLAISGVRVDTGDALIQRAIITYCRLYFQSPPDFDKLEKAYELQKTQLMHATGYTNFGGCGE